MVKHGVVIEQGTHERLMEQQGMYASLVALQQLEGVMNEGEKEKQADSSERGRSHEASWAR